MIKENSNAIDLSICIPTYNRGNHLIDALYSIEQQHENNIEVVISDNNSNDNTDQIIELFRLRFRNFIYYKSSQNLGAAKNFLKAVELAKGKFCWFLGSDDIIEKDGIKTILSNIKKNHQIACFITHRNEYDFRINTHIKKSTNKTDKLILDNEEFIKYILPRFGFISCCVFKKSCWNSVIKECINPEWLSPKLSSYIHTYILICIYKINSNFLFIGKPCVGWRSGNDSFLESLGFLNRMKIDVDGYEYMSKLLNYSSRTLKQVLFRHLFHQIVSIKINTKHKANEINNILTPFYKESIAYFIKIIPIMYFPRNLLLLLRAIKKHFKKNPTI